MPANYTNGREYKKDLIRVDSRNSRAKNLKIEDCRGSNCGCPVGLARERKTDGDEPCPYNFW